MAEQEVEALAEAIQAYASAYLAGEDPLVTQALVVFEFATIDEEGTLTRQISYTVPTDNFSISGALGLAIAAKRIISDSYLKTEE